MAIDDFKYLMVLHPPGAGGNHIANLISLCPGISPRFHTDDYINCIYNIYKQISRGKENQTCHGSKTAILQNLQSESLLKNVDYIKSLKDKFVFTSHAQELYTDHNYFKKLNFNPIRYILASYPTNPGLLKRVKTGPWVSGNPSDRPELYNKEYFKDIDPSHITLFNTDQFMYENGYSYLQEVLFSSYNLSLDDKHSVLHTTFVDFVNRVFG